MDTTSASFEELTEKALELGASDARIIPAEAVLVEDRFAQMCKSPQCNGYGQTINCPPHVMKPDEFRESLRQYKYALIFKIDVPTQTLLTDDRHDIARLVHEIAAGIEQFARDNGYTNSKGFAAGSCKQLFCNDYDRCRALDENSDCRFSEQARPSMSGLGVNFFELCQTLGWQINKITRDSDPDNVPLGMLAGMVLLK